RDRLVLESGEHRFLRIEDPSRAREALPFLARDLGDRTCRREMAVQYASVATWIPRRFERLDDPLPCLQRRGLGEILGQRLPGHRHRVAMEEPALQQVLHHCRGAADGM